jgi:hypothetical protein
MVRDNAAVEAVNESTPRDFIDEQFARLNRPSEEAARLADLTREVERNRAELVRLQSELRQVGERWARADAALNAIRAGSQRVSMILAMAVIVVAVVLWHFLTVAREQPVPQIPKKHETSEPRVDTSPPTVDSKALHVIGRIRSGTFESGASDCAPDERPCKHWQRDVPATRFDSFEAAVNALLAGISAPGPIVFVVEGGHDSESLSPSTKAEVGSNLNLAMLRAYYARTELEQLLIDRNYDATYISTVRSDTPRKPKMDSDRRVIITLLAAAQPQG